MGKLRFAAVGGAFALVTLVAAPVAASEPEPECDSGVVGSIVEGACESETGSRVEEDGEVSSLKKTADRKTYKTGDKITFTITIATDPDATSPDKFHVYDVLDGVLDDAEYNDDPKPSTGTVEPRDSDGHDILLWEGELDPGESASLTFSVTADAKGDKQIENFALYAAHNDSECGFSRSHGPAPGDIDFDDVPSSCKVTVTPTSGGPGDGGPGDGGPGDDGSGNGGDNGGTTPVGDNGSTLPITGSSLGGYIAAAAALLIVGTVLLVMARRRRSASAE